MEDGSTLFFYLPRPSGPGPEKQSDTNLFGIPNPTEAKSGQTNSPLKPAKLPLNPQIPPKNHSNSPLPTRPTPLKRNRASPGQMRPSKRDMYCSGFAWPQSTALLWLSDCGSRSILPSGRMGLAGAGCMLWPRGGQREALTIMALAVRLISEDQHLAPTCDSLAVRTEFGDNFKVALGECPAIAADAFWFLTRSDLT